MPREQVDSVQLSVRVTGNIVDELDELARDLSPPGIELTRADALRAVIARGMKELRADLAAKTQKKR